MEVFDEPAIAATKHRAGMRRLVAVQLREPLKYLEKNLPDLKRSRRCTSTSARPRSCARRSSRSRSTARSSPIRCRTTSVVQGAARRRPHAPDADREEVARQAHAVLLEYTAPRASCKDARPPKEVHDDIAANCSASCPSASSPPRHGRSSSTCRATCRHRCGSAGCAPTSRGRAAAGRATAAGAALLAPRRRTQRPGDARLDEFRWLIEELRVSLLRKKLCTPQPRSVKRLQRVWKQMDR